MSRPNRLDFHGAVHLVRVRGKEAWNIFFNPSVLQRPVVERWRSVPLLIQFFSLLDGCCSEYGAQLFGYFVAPNEASLVLRTLGVPLHAFMQRLGGRYSRYLHRERVLPNHVAAFASRYESKIVAPEYLPHAVRRLHAAPLRSGLARRPIDYPFSSASAHVGERAPVHLEAEGVWRALELKGLFGLRGYREFMEKPESAHVAGLFEHGSPLDARIVGSSLFVAQAHDAASHPRTPYSREQLLAGVAKLLAGEHAASLFKGPQAVLARALVAWFALNSGSASLREVGQWFGLSAAALGKAIRHYRRLSPELFQGSLPGLDEQRADL